jgi:2,3-bisphosphoglycerate-dependent phosphoglycerate mutase
LTLLYFVRHGENRANITREFSYRAVDYPLTARGVRQAEQTAEFFRGKLINTVYSSPLRRAVETAEVIASELKRSVVVVEQFREINVGLLEGQPPTDEAWAQHDRIGEAWRLGHHATAFPGGENYTALLARMRQGLLEVLSGREGQQVAVVGHGGNLAATIADLCPNARGSEAIYQPMPNCAISRVEMTNSAGVLKGRLLAWAETTHLREQ